MSNRKSPQRPQNFPPQRPGAPPEIVDPRWILKAGAIAVLVALSCAYTVLCVAFHYTQWEYVLQPSRDLKATPASAGLNFTEIHFGVDSSGQPQLDGWWIPSDIPSDLTVLMLHGGNGSMSDALPQARQLHDARLNVLLFDYRGFGKSGSRHPTEALMEGDAESALSYLTDTRGLQPAGILIYGNGLGASLAATICQQHAGLSGLILVSPEGDTTQSVSHDGRTKIIPVRLLFNQTFPLATTLHSLATPKLLVTYANTSPAPLRDISDPKMTVELPSAQDTQAFHQSLRRFLDTYVTTKPAPQPTPGH